MEEFELIERYFVPLASKESLNLKDDAACLSKGIANQVITTDNCVEGIHFFADDMPSFVAKKLLRRNLSDLLAMGADPKFYTLNIFLTEKEFNNTSWLESFSLGLKEEQEKFDIHLIGGDTTLVKGGKLAFSVTAIGQVQEGNPVLRSGAQVGDDIWVTGTIGLAQQGLLVREYLQKTKELPKLLDPADAKKVMSESLCPNIPFGVKLGRIANAAMDISDGFIQDASKIADLSKVKFDLIWENIPRPKNYWNLDDEDFKRSVLAGGDDYQLIFTAEKSLEAKINKMAKDLGVSISRVGEVSSGTGVTLTEKGEFLELDKFKKGWRYALS